MKIKKALSKFYNKIKLAIYKTMYHKSSIQHEDLSSAEYFCLQCIYLMEKPTISQFATFLGISAPNATYKVKQLIKKGYLQKEKSTKDGREFVLVPTEKFLNLSKEKEAHLSINEMKRTMSDKEQEKLDKIMDIINESNNA